jgi:SapC
LAGFFLMSAWYQHLPGSPTPAPLRKSNTQSWPGHRVSTAWKDLEFFPVAFSELHLIAHHLPIVVVDCGNGPEVLLDLREQKIVKSPVDNTGAWTLHYMPLALRLLPFGASESGEQHRLLDLQMGEDEARSNTEGAALRKTLAQYAQGRKRLSMIARTLIERGYLLPRNKGQDYRINMKMASRVDVATGGAVAFQILVIMLFSQKNLIISPDTMGFPLPVEHYKDGGHETELDLKDFLVDGSSIQF